MDEPDTSPTLEEIPRLLKTDLDNPIEWDHLLGQMWCVVYAKGGPAALLEQIDQQHCRNRPSCLLALERRRRALRCAHRLEQWMVDWQQSHWHRMPQPTLDMARVERLCRLDEQYLLANCHRNVNLLLATISRCEAALVWESLLEQLMSPLSWLCVLVSLDDAFEFQSIRPRLLQADARAKRLTFERLWEK